MNVFPFVLIRTGGDYIDALAPFLDTSSLLSETKKIIENKEALVKKKVKLSEELRKVIEQLSDPMQQKKLQNLRRDLFNDRNPNSRELMLALEIVTGIVREELIAYLESKKESEKLLEQFKLFFERETEYKRELLKKSVQEQEALQKGLVLSSQSLLSEIPDYTSKETSFFRKKEYRVENSLLQYLSRIYLKTSPFSTFTNLTYASLVNSDNFLHWKVDSDSIESHIRLNNYCLKHLKTLLSLNREIARCLKIVVNPTVELKDGYYQYLTNHLNIEAFQRIQLNSVLELLHETIEKNRGSLTLSELVSKITEEVDASEADLENFIRQLIELGIVEFDLGVSGLDPNWSAKLIRLLESLKTKDVPFADELISTLQGMNNFASEFQYANRSQRNFILHEAFERFRTGCEALIPVMADVQEEDERMPDNHVFKHHSSLQFHFRPEQIFLEDTVRKSEVEMSERVVSELMNKVDLLRKSLFILSSVNYEKEYLKHFFNQKYSEDKAVNVLEFYEAYIREFKKPRMEAFNRFKQTQEQNDLPDQIPAIKEMNEAIEEWCRAFQATLSSVNISENEFHISAKQLEEVNKPTKEKPYPSLPIGSWGIFAQFIQSGDETVKMILNKSFQGYGKLFSRFLHIFPKEIENKIVQRNSDYQKDFLFCEINDASYFNANLHPPLMPFEISIPGGHFNREPGKRIPVTDLIIRYNREEEIPELIHVPSGKRTFVFDLGFQSPRGRSPLFSLLQSFSLYDPINTAPLLQTINRFVNQDKNNEEVRIHPRILFEKDIILQRKAWIIPHNQFPQRARQESDESYYLKVQHWRKNLKIPEEVFVRLNSGKELKKDDHKPQYLHLAHPLFVRMFEKIISKSLNELKVEEMLPASDQMIRVNNRKLVSEFLLQWYNP